MWQGTWACAVLFVVAGCSGGSGGQATADCQSQVRLDGRTYTSYSFTDRDATKFAEADRAECHDVGEDAPGSVFADDPRQVAVWSFDGYSTEQVVGVRLDRDSFAVYVADEVSRAESDRIMKQLAKPDRP